MASSKRNQFIDIEARISRIRQMLHELKKEQDKIIWDLSRPSEMIIGCFYEVYKTCSKPNCCCSRGNKHGPFPALYVSIQGRRRLKMIRKADEALVKKKAGAYKKFQSGLKRIRKINGEVDVLLQEIKGYYLEEYE